MISRNRNRTARLLRAGAGLLVAGLLMAIGVSFAEVPQSAARTIALADLPQEARDVLVLIRRGGPFRYRQDGSVFGNREGKLPARKRGYYREYTVPTPGKRDRGARRIVAGADARGLGEAYYSDDHYNSFRRIEKPWRNDRNGL